MHEYRGHEIDGVTISDFGLKLKVTHSKATVEYQAAAAEFDEVIKVGVIPGRDEIITLDAEQLAWLDSQKEWVASQVAQHSDLSA